MCVWFWSGFPCPQELGSALVERDRALCERNDVLEKYCFEVKDKAEAQKELSQVCRDIEAVKEERDVARKERTEAIIQRDQLLREYYQARQVRHYSLPPLSLCLSLNFQFFNFQFSMALLA